jgi:hypothetical protein
MMCQYLSMKVVRVELNHLWGFHSTRLSVSSPLIPSEKQAKEDESTNMFHASNKIKNNPHRP